MAFFCIFMLLMQISMNDGATGAMKERLRAMQLPGMRPWYLRLDRFLAMADHLERHAPHCDRCRSLWQEAEELTRQQVRDKEDVLLFEEEYVVLMEKMSRHLKESHGYRLPNHYVSLYTLLFLVAGVAAGVAVAWLTARAGLQAGALTGAVAGLVTGRIVGNRKDKKIRAEGKWLYG